MFLFYLKLGIMNWIILIMASVFEVSMTFCLGKTKTADGSSLWFWGAAFVVSAILSMGLLVKAAQTLPISTAYPVWTGIGAVGTVIIGILFFHEPMTAIRLFFTSTLIISIIGLKIVQP